MQCGILGPVNSQSASACFYQGSACNRTAESTFHPPPASTEHMYIKCSHLVNLIQIGKIIRPFPRRAGRRRHILHQHLFPGTVFFECKDDAHCQYTLSTHSGRTKLWTRPQRRICLLPRRRSSCFSRRGKPLGRLPRSLHSARYSLSSASIAPAGMQKRLFLLSYPYPCIFLTAL